MVPLTLMHHQLLTCASGKAQANTRHFPGCLTSDELVNSALLTDLKRTTGSNASSSSQGFRGASSLSPFKPEVAIYLHKACNTCVFSRPIVILLASQLKIAAKQDR